MSVLPPLFILFRVRKLVLPTWALVYEVLLGMVNMCWKAMGQSVLNLFGREPPVVPTGGYLPKKGRTDWPMA